MTETCYGFEFNVKTEECTLITGEEGNFGVNENLTASGDLYCVTPNVPKMEYDGDRGKCADKDGNALTGVDGGRTTLTGCQDKCKADRAAKYNDQDGCTAFDFLD